LESNTPKARVARSVKNRDNDERLSSRNVKDGIRETTNQGAPQISINLRMQPGILLDRSKGVVERRAKLQTQPSLLLVVPLRRFGNITLSFWTEDEPLAH